MALDEFAESIPNTARFLPICRHACRLRAVGHCRDQAIQQRCAPPGQMDAQAQRS